MKRNIELFLEHIEATFGDDYQIKRVNSIDDGSPIHLGGKPELILSLETNDPSWGFAIAYLAAERRGIKRFSFGDLFTFDEPISQECDMIGFFVFSPSIIDSDTSRIETNGKPIFLTGMYPIYRDEIELYNEIGLKEFWFTEGFDLYNVKRKNLAFT